MLALFGWGTTAGALVKDGAKRRMVWCGGVEFGCVRWPVGKRAARLHPAVLQAAAGEQPRRRVVAAMTRRRT
jgi:hypothetical protein